MKKLRVSPPGVERLIKEAVRTKDVLTALWFSLTLTSALGLRVFMTLNSPVVVTMTYCYAVSSGLVTLYNAFWSLLLKWKLKKAADGEPLKMYKVKKGKEPDWLKGEKAVYFIKVGFVDKIYFKLEE